MGYDYIIFTDLFNPVYLHRGVMVRCSVLHIILNSTLACTVILMLASCSNY